MISWPSLRSSSISARGRVHVRGRGGRHVRHGPLPPAWNLAAAAHPFPGPVTTLRHRRSRGGRTPRRSLRRRKRRGSRRVRDRGQQTPTACRAALSRPGPCRDCRPPTLMFAFDEDLGNLIVLEDRRRVFSWSARGDDHLLLLMPQAPGPLRSFRRDPAARSRTGPPPPPPPPPEVREQEPEERDHVSRAASCEKDRHTGARSWLVAVRWLQLGEPPASAR
jgi:hypothetical protein